MVIERCRYNLVVSRHHLSCSWSMWLRRLARLGGVGVCAGSSAERPPRGVRQLAKAGRGYQIET